ncbi:hypothetical protein CKQ16_21795 [Salmonella enterica subsp. enterica serovar Newport]|nr:hypothetical protein [Salmonella enterica subsp. enterica serovar Newport]
MNNHKRIRTGGDPRTLPDYAALRDELNKLTHPARPDVNWLYAETLCLSLFDTNGADLQTAAWYTLVRTHRAELAGMNEGLALLEALITRAWGNLWPQPVHARTDILASLGQRLQQYLRTLTPVYADLAALYQAEKHLTLLTDTLQRLELKHQSGLDTLCRQIHAAVVRLESSPGDTGNPDACPVVSSLVSTRESHEPVFRRVYVMPPAEERQINRETPRPGATRKAFLCGAMTALLVSSLVLWGVSTLRAPTEAEQQLNAVLAPLPEPLTPEALIALRGSATANAQAEVWLARTQKQLEVLAAQPPDMAQAAARTLLFQTEVLWPERSAPLTTQWRRHLEASALPAAELEGWYQGMQQLQQLTTRLNRLDEQKGKYMTVSELKSQVFAITQAFSSAVPAEEQLRRLGQVPAAEAGAQRTQTQQALNQLLNRYALMEQKTTESVHDNRVRGVPSLTAPAGTESDE